jgi:hypothetical protein
MIQIDYDKVRESAKAAGVCPYARIKRMLYFRPIVPGDEGNCWICKSRYPYFHDSKTTQACMMIGVSEYSDIDGKHVCENFEKCHERAAGVTNG